MRDRVRVAAVICQYSISPICSVIFRPEGWGCHKARELLTEAIAMYRQIGMPKHIEMAKAMLTES